MDTTNVLQRSLYFLLALGLLFITLITSLVAGPKVGAYSGSGAGTEGDPYLISSCAQLVEIDDEPEAHYALAQSLDCSANGSDIMVAELAGSLDGNGFTITMAMAHDEFSELALFGLISGSVTDLNLAGTVSLTSEERYGAAALAVSTSGAEISNINSTVDVVGGRYTAGIVGNFVTSTATNVHVVASIEGTSRSGGIFGFSGCISTLTNLSFEGTVTGTDQVGGMSGDDGCEGPGSTINNVSITDTVITASEGSAGGLIGSAGEVTATNVEVSGVEIAASGNDVGGIFGRMQWGTTLSQSYATGSVEGDSNVGGLAGYVDGDSSISESFAYVDANGLSDDVGGVVGELGNGSVTNSYARGDVSATDGYAGGLVGYGSEESPISRSYSTGAVNDEGESGGLTGGDNDLISSDSFWDMETSGWEMSQHGTGKTTAEMKNVATFTDTSSEGLDNAWDFEENPNNDIANDNIWGIDAAYNNGYPCLTWSDVSCGVLEDSTEDLNGDEVPDNEQPNISGYTSSITGKTVVIDVGEDCEITTDDLVRESELSVQDPGYVYDNGLFDFAAACGDPGFTTTIKLYYYDVSINGLVARKHNPITNAFFNLNTYGATLEQQTINGQSVAVVTYQITDGGELDVDGEVNGELVDPAGLAASAVGSPNTGIRRL